MKKINVLLLLIIEMVIGVCVLILNSLTFIPWVKYYKVEAGQVQSDSYLKCDFYIDALNETSIEIQEIDGSGNKRKKTIECFVLDDILYINELNTEEENVDHKFGYFNSKHSLIILDDNTYNSYYLGTQYVSNAAKTILNIVNYSFMLLGVFIVVVLIYRHKEKIQ